MPIVKMPDGALVDIPDNAPPEQLNQLHVYLQDYKAANKPAGVLESLGRDAVSGFGKAAAGIPKVLSWMMPTDEMAKPIEDDAKRLEKFYDEVGAKSTSSPIAKAAAQGVGGALASGGVTPVAIVSGGTAGAGSEIAGRVSDNPLARFIGGLLGGLAGGGAMSLLSPGSRQSAKVAKEAMETLSPEMLKKAQAFQAAAKAQGLEMDLEQALKGVGAAPNNLTTIRDVVANKSQGNAVQRTLHEQPGQLSDVSAVTVGGIPGRNVGVEPAANALQEQATQRLQNVKNQRSKLWTDTLDNVRQTLRDNADQVVAGEQTAFTAADALAHAARNKIGAAQASAVAQAQSGRQAALGRLQQLEQELATHQAGDAASIAAQNARIEEAKKLVEQLRTPALPRGAAAGNTGRFFELPKRGESIDHDLINREVKANSIERNLPPPVPQAPSILTVQKQAEVDAARTAGAKAQANYDSTLANANKVSGTPITEELARDKAKAALDAAAAARAGIEQVPTAAAQQAIDALRTQAAKYPNSAIGKQLGDLASKLQVKGVPLSDPAQINQILKETANKLKSPDAMSKGIDKNTADVISKAVQETRTRLGDAFKPMKDANAAYSQFTDTVIDPLKKSVVGTVAGRRGAIPDIKASEARFTSLMDVGRDPTAPVSQIRTLGRELVKNGPEGRAAFENGFKTYIAGKVSKAFDSGTTSATVSTNQDAAKRLYEGLFKDSHQWAGLKDAMAVMADARGLPKDKLMAGLENLHQLVRATSSRPLNVGGMDKQELMKVAGNSAIADGMRVFSFLPANKAAQHIEDIIMGQTFKDFDRILTSPEGADLLIKLANSRPASRKTLILLGTFAGTATQADKQSTETSTAE